jgi:hypothetical protein
MEKKTGCARRVPFFLKGNFLLNPKELRANGAHSFLHYQMPVNTDFAGIFMKTDWQK